MFKFCHLDLWGLAILANFSNLANVANFRYLIAIFWLSFTIPHYLLLSFGYLPHYLSLSFGYLSLSLTIFHYLLAIFCNPIAIFWLSFGYLSLFLTIFHYLLAIFCYLSLFLLSQLYFTIFSMSNLTIFYFITYSCKAVLI